MPRSFKDAETPYRRFYRKSSIGSLLQETQKTALQKENKQKRKQLFKTVLRQMVKHMMTTKISLKYVIQLQANLM